MKDLATYIVTFNCGRTLVEPKAIASHLFSAWESPVGTAATAPDVIVLNLQELAPLGYAFLGGNFVKPYFDRFRQAVASAQKGGGVEVAHDYFNVLARNAGLTAIMLFVRDDLVDLIKSVHTAEVGVGFSDMGNKGAIGARVGWKVADEQPFLYTTFVSAHLAPFEAETQRRNEDYVNIVRGLCFSGADAREWRKEQAADENVPLLQEDAEPSSNSERKGMYSNDTHLFFAGDLNYRTALTAPSREDVNLYPQPTPDVSNPLHYSHLLEKDQLSQELHAKKTLHGLSEQPIHFGPTYKYHQDDDQPIQTDEDMAKWPWAKHRWPSWCDRILFSTETTPSLKVGKYQSLPLFRTSDHRPVGLSVAIPYQSIKTSEVSQQAPTPVDSSWQSRRIANRRKELAVGIMAYAGWTWEGNAVIFGTILVVLGSIWLSKSLT